MFKASPLGRAGQPSGPALRRALRAAAAGGAALLAVLGTQTVTSPSADAASAHVKCSARTLPGQPIRISPAVNSRTKAVRAEGTVVLENCTSPDRSQRVIRSGRLTFSGSATASCTAARDVRGSATVTWYDVKGGKVGTSTVVPRPGSGAALNTPLSGSVSKGRMAGSPVRATVRPTSDVRGCGSKGLSSVHGKGNVSFG
ncbi:hypothetical protein NX801_00500 [Streptomyces sp. LP05-1]|uniref:Ig-like domain-containing protein n=1 Tax=Streptomyces pyxinae TaxID=2970734 RepID=A0ABT2C9S9_9ACTN|nr:hypothetical protein [Streptomyces sp. LP05-1]MCS0634168.1 hypothetical protein [Streptomyces sp. LP05-1]